MDNVHDGMSQPAPRCCRFLRRHRLPRNQSPGIQILILRTLRHQRGWDAQRFEGRWGPGTQRLGERQRHGCRGVCGHSGGEKGRGLRPSKKLVGDQRQDNDELGIKVGAHETESEGFPALVLVRVKVTA